MKELDTTMKDLRDRIAAGSDVRRNPELPLQAHDLRELLVRKKIIR